MRAVRWNLSSAQAWVWMGLVLIGMAVLATDAPAAGVQRSFATPEDAAIALVQAVKANNRKAMLEVLGPGASDSVSSGDAIADRAIIERFLVDYETRHAIVRDGDNASLTLGSGDYPFAFPIVRSGERWRFDTAAGKDEMLARRVGENELNVIKVLQAIVDAQFEYASADRDGDGVLSYARRFASNPGKQDGLYWPVRAGEGASPLGALVAGAAGEGYRRKEQGPTPYHGYYYRMLEGQTSGAGSGALDYVVKGRAIGGFAVVAYPAKYANSGIMTFIASQDGKIYQSDLGPKTSARAVKMRQFDPGKGWALVPAQ